MGSTENCTNPNTIIPTFGLLMKQMLGFVVVMVNLSRRFEGVHYGITEFCNLERLKRGFAIKQVLST